MATDPRCCIIIFTGKTDPDNPDRDRQQAMILMPNDAPGVEVNRSLPVFDFYGMPDRASQVALRIVRVSRSCCSAKAGASKSRKARSAKARASRVREQQGECRDVDECPAAWSLARVRDCWSDSLGDGGRQFSGRRSRESGHGGEILHARLRHFHAAWCINHRHQGGIRLPPKVVQERFGHSSIAMTMDVYGHLFPTSDNTDETEAAERALRDPEPMQHDRDLPSKPSIYNAGKHRRILRVSGSTPIRCANSPCLAGVVVLS
jgi:hypothetical protein